MKLIIDIPEELANKEHWYTDKEIWTVIKAAQNGKPIPDNATNGDMIKAIFSNTELHKESDYVSLTIQDGVYLEDRDGNWWFAPYQKGGKTEC